MPEECQVPFPRWAEMGGADRIASALRGRDLDERLADTIAVALAEVFMELAREEEANYEYLCELIDSLGGGGGGVVIFSPIAPLELDTFVVTGGVNLRDGSMDASPDGTVVAVNAGSSFELVDVSDPTAMSSISITALNGAGAPQCFCFADDSTLLIGVNGGEIEKWDVSTPATPSFIAKSTIGNGSVYLNMQRIDDTYVAFTSFSPYLAGTIDWTNLTIASSTGLGATTNAYTMRLNSDLTYAIIGTGSSNQRLLELNVTDPTSVTISTLQTPGVDIDSIGTISNNRFFYQRGGSIVLIDWSTKGAASELDALGINGIGGIINQMHPTITEKTAAFSDTKGLVYGHPGDVITEEQNNTITSTSAGNEGPQRMLADTGVIVRLHGDGGGKLITYRVAEA